MDGEKFYNIKNQIIKALSHSIENLSELRDDLINLDYNELNKFPDYLECSNTIAKKILDNTLELVNMRVQVMEKNMDDEITPTKSEDYSTIIRNILSDKIDSNALFENFMNNTMNNFNHWKNQEFYSKEFLSNFF